MTDGSRPTAGAWLPVSLVGVASGLLYAVVGGTQRAIQRTSAIAGTGPALRTGLYLMATLGLFALYALLLVMCRRGALGTRRAQLLAFGFPVVFNVLFLLVPPSLSIDLLSYISHGYIRTELNGNPYLDPSSIVAHTPLGPQLLRYGWRPVHPVSPYGPIWTHLETIIAQVFDGVRVQLLSFKLVIVVSSLGSGLLIWRILAHVRPERQLLGTLAFLWNPVIIVELAGEGHNDALMVFLVVLALLLTIKGRGSIALVTMSLGVLVKYLPVFLMPSQLVYLWRTRRTTPALVAQIASGIAVAALLAAALLGPLWAGADTQKGVLLSGRLGQTGSTPTMLHEALSRFLPASAAEPLVYLLLVVGFAVFVWTQAASVTDADGLLRSCASIALVYVLLVSPGYWPWYGVMPVALMALVPTDMFLALLFAVSAGSRLVAPLDLLFVHEVIDRRTFLLATWAGAICLPLVVLVVCLVRRSRSARDLGPERILPSAPPR